MSSGRWTQIKINICVFLCSYINSLSEKENNLVRQTTLPPNHGEPYLFVRVIFSLMLGDFLMVRNMLAAFPTSAIEINVGSSNTTISVIVNKEVKSLRSIWFLVPGCMLLYTIIKPFPEVDRIVKVNWLTLFLPKATHITDLTLISHLLQHFACFASKLKVF